MRGVHGRQDFAKNIRTTMTVEGVTVAMVGDKEASSLAGLDFWPSAMRALRHIVSKTSCGIVLSSDWRKDETLRDGVNGMLREYRIPTCYGYTPDLETKAVGVVKALHSSFREKRCKEIRKWLRQHKKVTRFVAIDDIDLSSGARSAQDLQRESEDRQNGESIFMNPMTEFVRCNPQVGLTMELAKLAVMFLNGEDVDQETLDAAYGTGPATDDAFNPSHSSRLVHTLTGANLASAAPC
eukprot:gnl/TRDRNA2_/TRDRNA2_176461_c0_seq12.p1 gnl/TRDRNA2_/TRDRNA2_176461_c0~~gnl/TRDRNA2_/TRDRNA2_176461_c0_seq12.p1  ORF type:complete len:239 (-),score=39.26 gnl/TRDRNA2_/TRDRNA2_176461_c0_seq12:336-1052(-)